MSDPLKIMVVDDESIVGKRLKSALEKSGYVVEVCEDGSSAVRRIDEQVFDIVVTDVRMEGVDGLEVLRQVRARSPRTAVIMITGYATVDVAREALTLGAFDFIAKPFRLDDLRTAITRAAAHLAATPTPDTTAERGPGAGRAG